MLLQVSEVSPETIANLHKYLNYENTDFTLKNVATFLDSCKVEAAVNGSNFSLRVFMPERYYIPDILISKVAHRISQLYKHSKHLDFFVVPVPECKVYPEPGQYITPQNMNSGYTVLSGSSIYVYRLEEWPKIVLHELMHHTLPTYNLDVSMLLKEFNIAQNILIQEAIVETYAVYFQHRFVATELGLSIKGVYSQEVEWSKKQAARLLQHQDTLKGGIWKESSNAFCYIFLKAHFLANIKTFLAGDIQNLINSCKKSSYILPVQNHTTLRSSLYGDL